MSDVLLLVGNGGTAELEFEVEDTETANSSVVDLSRVVAFTARLVGWTNGGAVSVQVQQSFDGVNWADLGSALTAAGDVLNQKITDGPHGLIRFRATFDDSDSAFVFDSSSDSSHSSYSWSGPFSTVITVAVTGVTMQINQ